MSSLVKTIVILAGLAGLLDARPTIPGYVLHERQDRASPVWIRRERVKHDAVLPMKIGLRQENLEKGYEYVLDVSDPDSLNYGKHWTEEQVHAAFEPKKETVDTVRRWLFDSGIASHRIIHSDSRGWLHFRATAAEAESLLKTTFHEHEHVSNGKRSIAADDYHLPEHVSRFVDYVTPGVKPSVVEKRSFPRAPPSQTRTFPGKSPIGVQVPKLPLVDNLMSNLSKCNEFATPACIAALYDIPEPNSDPVPGNALGIYQLYSSYAQEDLDSFFGNFSSFIPKGTHPTLASINGDLAPSPVASASTEVDMDFQMAYPIIYPQEMVDYQVNFGTFNGYFNTFLDALDGSYCNYTAYGETGDDPVIDPTYPNKSYNGTRDCGTQKPTNVISNSWGPDEIALPAYYQQRQCNEWMKLALQGITVVTASGDTGLEGFPDIFTPGGCLGSENKVFNPSYLTTCPYVTAVGATMLPPNGDIHGSESAVYDDSDPRYLYTSGGGFSNVFPAADYQKAAIDDFFGKFRPPFPSFSITGGYIENGNVSGSNGVYNRIGRGFPDVSALGVNMTIVNKGVIKTGGGTSASAPLFAGIVTRLNDARLKVGKSKIGFINPVLYKNPQVLNDITKGKNVGCGQEFPAIEGWDPVTGLGTPNFPKMLELFLALP